MSGGFSNSARKPRSRRQPAEVAAGIGDDGECRARRGGGPRTRQVAAGLDRGPRLRGGDEQRAVGRAARRPTRATAAGSVVSRTRQVEGAGGPGRRAGQHLGEQARAAHAHDDARGRCRRRRAPRRGRSTSLEAGRPCRPATSSQPSRSATSVGSSCQSVWSPRPDRGAPRRGRRGRRGRPRPAPAAIRGGRACRRGSRRHLLPAIGTDRPSRPTAVDRSRQRARTARRRPATPMASSADVVGVGEAREQRPRRGRAPGRRRGRAGAWKKRGVARPRRSAGRRRSRPAAVGAKYRPTSEPTPRHHGGHARGRRRPGRRRPASVAARRAERVVGGVVEQVEDGEAGGGGERVPRQRAGLVHGAERRERAP